MTEHLPIRVYGYCRVSTEDQASDGVSLEMQEKKIRAFASLKDLNLVGMIRDEGYSAKSMNRPGLNKLLELVSGPETDGVIIYKLDRLTRKTRDLLKLVEEIFKEGDTQLFSITENIDTTSPNGILQLTILGAMSQWEREQIAQRTREALQYKKSQGFSLGLVYYGYHREKGILRPNPQEQNVIRRMKRMRTEGRSYKAIAEKLNERGVPTRKKGAKWYPSTVRGILIRKKIELKK